MELDPKLVTIVDNLMPQRWRNQDLVLHGYKHHAAFMVYGVAATALREWGGDSIASVMAAMFMWDGREDIAEAIVADKDLLDKMFPLRSFYPDKAVN